MKPVRASIVMATYNGEKYIEQQLISILDNMSEEDELIISDDGSEDSTISIISKYIRENIAVISGPQMGVMKNFENAIGYAKGKIIFLSDQDDIWMENKLEETLRLFNDEKIMAVVNDVTLIDENNNIIIHSFFEYRKSKGGVLNNIVRNSYLGCAMCFRSIMADKILPIPTSKFINDQWHDQWIGLLCDCYGKVFLNKAILGYYRRHEGNKSSMKHGTIIQMIVNRVVIIYFLFIRIMRIA